MSKQRLRRRQETDETAEYDLIGENRPRVDSWRKCTGQQEYTGDIEEGNLSFARIKRSTEAHARITEIETSEAESMDGVVAVITGDDLSERFGYVPIAEDEPPLAQEKVRYVGEPVAAVAAIDEATADRAREAITVEYDPIDTYTSIDGALDESAVPIPEESGEDGNVDREVSLEFGDVSAGFEEADHVREDVFFYQGNTHLPLEEHSALASWEAGKEKLHLYASTQIPHYLHRKLAKVLDLPERKIHVDAPQNGGGFGGKADYLPHQFIVAKLSMVANRPVKITLTREEVFYAHRGRHPVLMWVKTGVTDSGEILSMDFKTFLDGGAYASLGPVTTYYTGSYQPLTYRIPNYRFRGLRVNTNKPPCGPKRGNGTPQPRYGLELHMSNIARDLGLSPLEIRRRNQTDEDELTTNWMEITSNGLGECIDEVVEQSGFEEKYSQEADGHGIGLAVSSFCSGAGHSPYFDETSHSKVIVRVDRSGNVTAYSGALDVGQGSDSVLASIVAEVLGLDPLDIDLEVADTDTTPVDLGSYSSRVTFMMGNAAKEAAEEAREELFEGVADELEVPAERLEAEDGEIYDSRDPDTSISFEEAARNTEADGVGEYHPPDFEADYKGSGIGPSPAFSFSAAAVELDVDEATGEIDIEDIWIAHDVGTPINEMSVEGQIEGSVYMALGEVLMEEQKFHDDGLHRSPSMLDYKHPTIKDMPPVDSTIVETEEPNGPFGAKEAGQGPLLPVLPALTDAVKDALDIEISETPITARKVRRALQGREIGPDEIPDYEFPEPVEVEPPEEDWMEGL